ncbi:MafI family immunity protein [Actinosynnema sp. NPDC002837]
MPAVIVGGAVQVGEYVVEITKLLEESPVSTPSVIVDVRDFLKVGEYGLAFHLMCSWIYEDELPISAEFHRRLVRLSEELDSRDLVLNMAELISH